jgi:hypothetical protein
MLADYLSASNLIIDRIRAAVPGVVSVLPARDLANVVESTLQSPSVFVVYDGDRLSDTGGRGQAQVIQQRWLVVLAVRNARQADGGAGLAADAGPLITDLLQALQGWQPSPDFRPLIRVASPKPGYSPAFAYYPLAFECQIFTLGD